MAVQIGLDEQQFEDKREGLLGIISEIYNNYIDIIQESKSIYTSLSEFLSDTSEGESDGVSDKFIDDSFFVEIKEEDSKYVVYAEGDEIAEFETEVEAILFLQDEFEAPRSATRNGDAKLDTLINKFGEVSLSLDGDGDYASISSQSAFGFGSDDFTVEGWVYPKSKVSFEELLVFEENDENDDEQQLFDFRAGTIRDNSVAINLDGLTPQVYVNGGYTIIGDTNLTLDDWNHLAYVREGTTGTLYLNGTDVGSSGDSTDYGTSKPLVIGSLFDGSANYFLGNIDDVRVVKGVAIVPPEGGPTSEAAVTNNTVLMLGFDGDFETEIISATNELREETLSMLEQLEELYFTLQEFDFPTYSEIYNLLYGESDGESDGGQESDGESDGGQESDSESDGGSGGGSEVIFDFSEVEEDIQEGAEAFKESFLNILRQLEETIIVFNTSRQDDLMSSFTDRSDELSQRVLQAREYVEGIIPPTLKSAGLGVVQSADSAASSNTNLYNNLIELLTLDLEEDLEEIELIFTA